MRAVRLFSFLKPPIAYPDLLCLLATAVFSQPGCKDPTRDPHASIGAPYRDALGGWCTTKKATAVFLWLLFSASFPRRTQLWRLILGEQSLGSYFSGRSDGTPTPAARRRVIAPIARKSTRRPLERHPIPGKAAHAKIPEQKE